MPETQLATITKALDPVYESFANGDGLRGVIATPDERHWVAVSCDRLELAWPFSEEPVAGFCSDMARYLPGLAVRACEPGKRLELSLELPKLKRLAGVIDQIFAKVYKLGEGYVVLSRVERMPPTDLEV